MAPGPLPAALPVWGPGRRWLYCEGGTLVLGRKAALRPPACHPASGGGLVSQTPDSCHFAHDVSIETLRDLKRSLPQCE